MDLCVTGFCQNQIINIIHNLYTLLLSKTEDEVFFPFGITTTEYSFNFHCFKMVFCGLGSFFISLWMRAIFFDIWMRKNQSEKFCKQEILSSALFVTPFGVFAIFLHQPSEFFDSVKWNFITENDSVIIVDHANCYTVSFLHLLERSLMNSAIQVMITILLFIHRFVCFSHWFKSKLQLKMWI